MFVNSTDNRNDQLPAGFMFSPKERSGAKQASSMSEASVKSSGKEWKVSFISRDDTENWRPPVLGSSDAASWLNRKESCDQRAMSAGHGRRK